MDRCPWCEFETGVLTRSATAATAIIHWLALSTERLRVKLDKGDCTVNKEKKGEAKSRRDLNVRRMIVKEKRNRVASGFWSLGMC